MELWSLFREGYTNAKVSLVHILLSLARTLLWALSLNFDDRKFFFFLVTNVTCFDEDRHSKVPQLQGDGVITGAKVAQQGPRGASRPRQWVAGKEGLTEGEHLNVDTSGIVKNRHHTLLL